MYDAVAEFVCKRANACWCLTGAQGGWWRLQRLQVGGACQVSIMPGQHVSALGVWDVPHAVVCCCGCSVVCTSGVFIRI